MEKKFGDLLWVLVALVAIIAGVSVIVSLIYGGRYSNGTFGPFGMMGGYYGTGIVMPVIGAISVILVIVFIYFVFESVREPQKNGTYTSSWRAEEIAKERFAKGEINEAEYNRIIEKIRGQ